MKSLIETSDSLQKEVLNIVTETGLVHISSEIGELNLVGSAAYNLMTWRDIDFNLITPDTPKDSDYWKLVQHIFMISGVKKLTLVDNRANIEKDRPKSMYIGVTYEDSNKESWKIDIRLLSKDDVTTDTIADLINQKLTEETRLYILEIKTQVHDNPRYHKGFSSVDIYNAVLLQGVKTLAGFEKYLNSLGKSL